MSDPWTVFNAGPVIPDREYFWSVRAMLDTTWTTYLPLRRLFVLPPLDTLPAPMLTAPADADSVQLPETFSWTTVTSALEYQFEIATGPTFDSIVHTGVTAVNSTTVPDLSDIQDDSSYYWRVQAIDQAHFPGHWSTTWSFVKKPLVLPPSTPTAFYPPSTDTTIADTMVLAWSYVAGATCYELEYSIDTTVSITFRIYTLPSGILTRWTEMHPDVEIVDGLFTVQLGKIVALGPTVFNGSGRGMAILCHAGLDPASIFSLVGRNP